MATLPEHIQRVIVEHSELQDKLTKLDSFIDTETCASLPLNEQNLLLRQRNAMYEYAKTLLERIDLYNVTPEEQC